MKVVTAAEMRAIDERTIGEFDISADALTLEAGRAVVTQIQRRFAPARVVIFCGKGNNAGDGFIVAHELSRAGVEVDVLCLETANSYAQAAAGALARLQCTPARVQAFSPDSARQLITESELVVDALLGTGVRGAMREPYHTAAEIMNSGGRPVVCVDVPSGLGENTPENSTIIKGVLTVSIGLPKLSLFTPNGLQHSGEVLVVPIQFPRQLTESDNLRLNWAASQELADWLPPRAIDSNKGTFGTVGILAGSTQFAGAAILMARAALRTGCGLVTIFCPAEMNAIFKTALPEATSRIVPSKDGQGLDTSSASQVLEHSERVSVLAIGPGLATTDEQSGLLSEVLNTCNRPVVLDADALTLIARNADLGNALKMLPDCVLTPHPGEMARLLGVKTADVQADRIAAVEQAVQRLGVSVLLKGAGTLVGRPDGQKWIVRGGTSALAKGGTGDVLTGVIASLVAQGMPCCHAAVLGATAHVEAGASCACVYGERGVLAGEVADEVPRVLDSWTRQRKY